MDPIRKGSVLEALILKSITSGDMMRRSEWHNVTAGSKDLTWDDVYSETRRNPKKAVNMAARSINLSSYSNVDMDRLERRMKRIVGVMGSRLGLENL